MVERKLWQTALSFGMPENRRTAQNTAGLHRKTAGHINDNRKNDF